MSNLPPPPPPPRRTVPPKPAAPPATFNPSLPSARTTSEFAPPPTKPNAGKPSALGGLFGSGPGKASPASGATTPTGTSSGTGEKKSWKEKRKEWGTKAYEKGFQISDSLGGRVNSYAEKLGSERFWPTTGDFPEEMDKAARILRAFTVDGLETKVEVEVVQQDGKKAKKSRKVLRKIPPAVFKEAKGLVIFTSMRSAIAPFGGAGGTGVAIARLPDGTWSAPSALSPNNLSTGFMVGFDVYDCVLVIRTAGALTSFATHNFTLGTDIGVVAGPFGAGAAMEAGMKDRTPVYSYVRSRGLYAGVALVGQVFVDRFEENAKMYHYPGIKAGDILTGRVKVPHEAARLMEALEAAETGEAQAEKGGELDAFVHEGLDGLKLDDGEVLHLPPTPEQAEADYGEHEKLDSRSRLEMEATRKSLSEASKQSPTSAGLPQVGEIPADAYPRVVVALAAEHHVAGDGHDEMEESTRREYEQHRQAEQAEELARLTVERKPLGEQGRSTSELSDTSVYSFEDAPEYSAGLGASNPAHGDVKPQHTVV